MMMTVMTKKEKVTKRNTNNKYMNDYDQKK